MLDKRIDVGDRPETTTDNPRSWIAWKRRAEIAETRIVELKKLLASTGDTPQPQEAGRWANTICGACQIMDAWKNEPEWSDWDRQIRSELTDILTVLYAAQPILAATGKTPDALPTIEQKFKEFVEQYARLNGIRPQLAVPKYDHYVEGASDFADYLAATLPAREAKEK